MSSSAQKSARSFSSQSSHHSSVEPRGAPEFNREYARQLSLAKRSRSTSKVQGRSADTNSGVSSAMASPVSRSPQSSQPVSAVSPSRFNPLGSLFSSAKEMSATTPNRNPDTVGLRKADESPRVPMAQRPPLAPSTPSVPPRASEVASPVSGTGSPLAKSLRGAVEKTLSGSTSHNTEEDTVSVARAIQVVLLVWVFMLVLFCGISFVAADDAAYRPHYFSFTSATQSALNTTTVYKPHGIDRLVPQMCRQLALRLRNCGHLIGSAFMSGGQLQVLGMVFSDIADGILLAVRAAYDRIIAPLVLFFSSQGHRAWATLTAPFLNGNFTGNLSLSSVVQPLSQTVNFLLVDPTRVAYDTTVSFFVSGADALRYVYYSFVSHDPQPASHNSTPRHPPSRRHRAVRNTTQRSSGSLKALGKQWWQSGKNMTRGILARGKKMALALVSDDAPIGADRINATPIAFRFQAHYQRRLQGDLWGDILATSFSDVEALVSEELVPALRLSSRGAITRLGLRAGSLIVDVDVTQEASATPSRPDKNGGGLSKKENRAAQKNAVDGAKAALQKWPFSSVMTFYDRRAAEIKSQQAEQRRETEQLEKQRAAAAAASSAKALDDCTCLRTATAASTKHCVPPPPHLPDLCHSLTDDATTAANKECSAQLTQKAEQAQKLLTQQRDAQARAVAVSEKKCADALESARKSSDSAERNLREALDQCLSASKVHEEACRKKIAEVQDAAALAASTGGDKALAAAMAASQAELAQLKKACDDRLASEVTRCQAAREQAQAESAARAAAALKAEKERCVKELQLVHDASEEARKKSSAALEKCKHAATQQEKAHEELIKAHKSCEAHRASEEAQCRSERVDTNAQHETDQAAAVEAAISHCERQHRAEITTKMTQCHEAAAKAQEAAVTRAKEECAMELAAQSARMMNAARTEVEQSCAEALKHSVADATQCANAKSTVESRLAKERADWEREKEALIASGLEKERDFKLELQTSAQLAAANMSKACAIRIEEAVDAAVNQQRLHQDETCSAQLDAQKTSLNATYAAVVAEALRAQRDADATAASRKLERERAAAYADGQRQTHQQYADVCEEACITNGNRKGDSQKCVRAAMHLREGANASSNRTVIGALLPSDQVRTPPVCGLAWSDAVSWVSGTPKRSASSSSLHSVAFLVLVVVISVSVTYASVRAAFREHRTAAFLRDEVRKLQKEVESLEREQTRQLPSSSSTSPGDSPRRLSADSGASASSQPATATHDTQPQAGWEVPFAAILDDHFDIMSAWHFTCCNLLWMSASGGALESKSESAFGDRTLTSPPLWRQRSPPASVTPEEHVGPADEEGQPPSPRLETAPSTPIQEAACAPAASEAALPATSVLERRVVRAYYYMLESYYVDLLESVTNRELIEHQLEEMEDVASKQMSLLQNQAHTVKRLQEEVSGASNELAAARKQHRTECAAYQQQIAKQSATQEHSLSALRAELEKAHQETRQATQMRNLQAEMVAVLEEQLSRVTNALQDSQSSPTAAEAQAALQPTSSGVAHRSSATPRMTRDSDSRREYRALDWRDAGDNDEL